jgi:hypothetical protein
MRSSRIDDLVRLAAEDDGIGYLVAFVIDADQVQSRKSQRP